MGDDRIGRLARRLKAHGRVRVPLRDIWDDYQRVYGCEASGVQARAELRTVLDSLRAGGACAFPSENGRAWDRTSTVALPQWVRVPQDSLRPEGRRWRKHPWHPELAWVRDLTALSAEQEDFLLALQRALVDGRLAQKAPLKYRSLQLTGDEKRLESMLSSQLFAPGRLSLELLNCDGPGLPLTYECVGAEPRMIVFENAGSYIVARRVLKRIGHPPYGFVAYGGGNRVLRSAEYLREISGPLAVDYVGDLDATGIEIGVAFADRVRTLSGFAVGSATDVHMAMLDAARELGHPDGWPSEGKATVLAAHRWLSPSCAPRVKRILSVGNRVPEEVLHDGHYGALWGAP